MKLVLHHWQGGGRAGCGAAGTTPGLSYCWGSVWATAARWVHSIPIPSPSHSHFHPIPSPSHPISIPSHPHPYLVAVKSRRMHALGWDCKGGGDKMNERMNDSLSTQATTRHSMGLAAVAVPLRRLLPSGPMAPSQLLPTSHSDPNKGLCHPRAVPCHVAPSPLLGPAATGTLLCGLAQAVQQTGPPSWPQALLLEGPALAYNGINPPSCSWPRFHPCVNCHQVPGPWGHWAAGGMGSLHSSAKHCCCPCTELDQDGRIPCPPLLTPWQPNCTEMLYGNVVWWKCCMLEILHGMTVAWNECCVM